MNKDELLAKFQRLGKVLMTPVLILPIAGILQGFGNAFTSPTLTAAVPWLAAPGFAIFFSILKAAAGIVMNNIPVIFSICLGLIGQNVCPRWGYRRRSMPLFQPFKFRARF